MTDEEMTLVSIFKQNRTKGTYQLAEYMIKKFNIKDLNNFDKNPIRIETQRILKELVTERAKMDVIKKIKEFTL